ncbi:unknown [Firmicutes bacterium CAG:884]|nr:unknown [Firmicutes bacterium CAG:884]
MKMMKSLMLMMVGGASVLAYQKYKEPLMNKMNAMLDQKM